MCVFVYFFLTDNFLFTITTEDNCFRRLKELAQDFVPAASIFIINFH